MKYTIQKFKSKLKYDGRTLRWFYDRHIAEHANLTYNAMALQLNGYTSLNERVLEAMQEYLNKN